MADTDKSQSSHSISRKRRKRSSKKPGLKWFQIKRAFFTLIDLSPTEIARHWRRHKNKKERQQAQASKSDGNGGKKLSSDYEKVPSISAKMKEDRMAAMEELNRRRDNMAEEKLVKRSHKKRRSRSSSSSRSRDRSESDETEITLTRSRKPFLIKSLFLTAITVAIMTAVAFTYHEILGIEWKPETDYYVYYKHTAAQNQGGTGAVAAISQIKTSAEWITAEDRFSFIIINDVGKKVWMRKKNGDIIKHTPDDGWISSSNIDGKIQWKPLSSNLQFILDHVAFPIAPLNYIENNMGEISFSQFSNTFDLLCYQLNHSMNGIETTYHAAYKRGLSILAERTLGSSNVQLTFGNFKKVDAYEVPFSIHQKIHGQKALTIRIKSINFKTKWKNENQESNNI